MIRGPIRHQPVPGDIPTGVERPYKGARLMVTTPTLPIRIHFYDALPATFVPLLVGGQGGRPMAPRSPYRGLAPSKLFPIIEKRDPWE